LSINPNTGTISGVPNNVQPGQQFNVTISATDINGTTSQTVTLTVANPQATIITVNTLQDTPPATVVNGVWVDVNGNISLQCAIATANSYGAQTPSGLTTYITFDPALNGGVIQLQGPLPPLAGFISIIGPGAGNLTIAGAGNSGIFQVQGGTLSVSGVTIYGGQNAGAGNGGAFTVGNSGTLFLDSVVIQNCTATTGGAIYNNGGSLTVSNSQLIQNNAIGNNSFGGAIATSSGTTTISGTLIQGNGTDGRGGGIAIQGTGEVNLYDTTVEENTAVNGGGVYNSGGYFQMQNGSLDANTATANGGGLLTEGTSVLSNVTIYANSATGNNSQGGDIADLNGTCVVSDSSFGDYSWAGSGQGNNLFVQQGATFTDTNCTGLDGVYFQ
jgi:hypothetical protein